MPEGPEVERVRRTLEPWLIGARVLGVSLRRRDVVVGDTNAPGPAAPDAGQERARARGSGSSRARASRATPSACRPRAIPREHLLLHDTVTRLDRHGKQLAIIAASGRSLVVHLGMTGKLIVDAPSPLSPPRTATIPHTHITWRLQASAPHEGTPASLRLRFIDPRRFGGVWTISSPDALAARFAPLGPDATRISGAHLAAATGRSIRPIKAALLDQGVVAGVGNIYADESLFAARIDPRRESKSLSHAQFDTLAIAIRRVIKAAIDAGGSTIRDYADANGAAGAAQHHHAVYARAALPCVACRRPLAAATVAQRTTVWCVHCQQ